MDGIAPRRKLGVFRLVLLVFLGGILLQAAMSIYQDHAAKQAQIDSAQRLASLQDSLTTARPRLVAQGRSKIAAGSPEEAVKLLQPYEITRDPEIEAVLTEGRIAINRASLQKAAVSDHSSRVFYLTQLHQLAPDDKAVDKQLAAEQKIFNAEQSAMSSLGPRAFCVSLKKHLNSSAWTTEFINRGGNERNLHMVLNRQVNIGMSEFEARCAWGDPERVNTDTTAGGTRKQLVYSSTSYLYITNGVLTGIQGAE